LGRFKRALSTIGSELMKLTANPTGEHTAIRRIGTWILLLLAILAAWFVIAALLTWLSVRVGPAVTPTTNPAGITVMPSVLLGLATILLGVAALLREQIVDLILPVKLLLVPHRLRGTFVPKSPTGHLLNARYYSLGVKNLSGVRTGKNCTVVLTHMLRLADGTSKDQDVNCRFPFIWGPANRVPNRLDIRPGKSEPLDLVSIYPDKNPTLVLQYYTMNFDVQLYPGTARLWLEIEADGYRGKSPSIWEISWDGQWALDDGEMAKHLTIRDATKEIGQVQQNAGA
jgi:hypothetical protein